MTVLALQVFVVGAVFLASGICRVFAMTAHLEMIDKINLWLPEERRIPTMFAGHRAFEAERLYREMFPEGKLLKRERLFSWAAIAGFVLDLALICYWTSRR